MDKLLTQNYPDNSVSVCYKVSNQGFTDTLITGSRTSNGKCLGFCNFDMHKGFLNRKLIEIHHCHEKKCPFFYTVKSLTGNQKGVSSINKEEMVKSNANKAIEKYDYMKIVFARQCEQYYLLTYAAVCKINEMKIAKLIQEKCNVSVMLKQINQPFEKMVSIVYGI